MLHQISKINGASPYSSLSPWQKYFDRYAILNLIGRTPLLQLDLFQHLSPDLNVYLKCEWQNPGGSIKDRPVREMLLSALDEGQLTPGKTILDSSSGNAGIAYALLGGALGYAVEVVVPGNASKERILRLKAHGARVRQTDPLLGYDEALRKAHQMQEEEPEKYFLPDQYANDNNWRAHFFGTGQEILEQTEGQITHFIAGVGTGGSLTGIGRRLKEHRKDIQIIKINPERFPGIEGLKPMGEPEDIVPKIFDPSIVDRQIPVTVESAAATCQKLALKGIFVGLSTGAYLSAVGVLAQEKIKGTLVTLACDSGERYFSTGLWEK